MEYFGWLCIAGWVLNSHRFRKRFPFCTKSFDLIDGCFTIFG